MVDEQCRGGVWPGTGGGKTASEGEGFGWSEALLEMFKIGVELVSNVNFLWFIGGEF